MGKIIDFKILSLRNRRNRGFVFRVFISCIFISVPWRVKCEIFQREKKINKDDMPVELRRSAPVQVQASPVWVRRRRWRKYRRGGILSPAVTADWGYQ